MDIEETREAKERKAFSPAIEELLEKERTYRQNNEYNASTVVLPQIVGQTHADRARLRDCDSRRRLPAAAAADQEARPAGQGAGRDGAQGDDLPGLRGGQRAEAAVREDSARCVREEDLPGGGLV